jgi:hypothetical protein
MPLPGKGNGRRLRMLSRCANSQCSKPFLRLREGRLFLVETGPVAEPLHLTRGLLLLGGNLRSEWNTPGCVTSVRLLELELRMRMRE